MDVRGRSLRVPSAHGSRVEAAQSLPEPNVGPDDSDIDLERSGAYVPVQDTHTDDSEPLRQASYLNPDSALSSTPDFAFSAQEEARRPMTVLSVEHAYIQTCYA